MKLEEEELLRRDSKDTSYRNKKPIMAVKRNI
jgi:hypothetical protein